MPNKKVFRHLPVPFFKINFVNFRKTVFTFEWLPVVVTGQIWIRVYFRNRDMNPANHTVPPVRGRTIKDIINHVDDYLNVTFSEFRKVLVPTYIN